MPTHFRSGVSNVAPGNLLFDYGRVDPTTYVEYFTDFVEYVAGDWVVTETGTATQALSTGAGSAGGYLIVTNAAADDDASFSQLVGEAFRYTAGKRMFFKARFKVSDATQSDVIIGLAITDTTPIDATDGIFFLKADGSTTMNLIVRKNSTDTTTSIGALVTDTFVEVGFVYEPGDGFIHVFKDGSEVGKSVLTNAPDDEDLTVTFGFQNGEAVAKIGTIDYILAAQER